MWRCLSLQRFRRSSTRRRRRRLLSVRLPPPPPPSPLPCFFHHQTTRRCMRDFALCKKQLRWRVCVQTLSWTSFVVSCCCCCCRFLALRLVTATFSCRRWCAHTNTMELVDSARLRERAQHFWLDRVCVCERSLRYLFGDDEGLLQRNPQRGSRH